MFCSLVWLLPLFASVPDAYAQSSSIASLLASSAAASSGSVTAAAAAPLAVAATSAANVPTPSNWKAQASTTSAAQECTKYYFAPVAALVSSFPTVWQIATIPAADTIAQGYFNSMTSSIPKIAVKGTPTGDFSTFTPTYDHSDPDCWWTFNKCVTPKLSGLTPDVSTCPTPHTWGYTLDDGPNCSHNAFYDYLNSQNQKASLFYIGSNIIDWPLEAQRGLAEGHEICAHTWSHRYMTALTNEQAFAELYYSKKIIHDVLGITVKCWRPPFGDVDDRIRYIANQVGMETIIWDNDTNDFAVATIGVQAVEQNYQNILNNATAGTFDTRGTVVLSHEINNDTMSLSQQYLPHIKSSFQYIVPVGVCQNQTSPYEETDYKYPTFEEYISGTTSITSNPTPAMNTAQMSVPVATSSGSPVSVDNGKSSSSSKSISKSKSSSAISNYTSKTIPSLFFVTCIAAGALIIS